MNAIDREPGKKQPNPYKPSKESSDSDRQLFVTTDLRSIPAMELRPMCGSFGKWLGTVISFKLLRATSEPTFAFESRRLVRVEAEQVPKRIMKRFHEFKSQLDLLGFLPNYFASLPAIGQIAAAVMTMSRPDGYIDFYANQVVVRSEGEITDDGHFGFRSRLTDETLISTVSRARLPGAPKGFQRVMVASEDPAEVLRVHRKRIRDAGLIAVPPQELIEHARKETRIEAEDLLRRRIIRPATQREISRIRNLARR